MSALDILGWVGASLIVLSLMQARVLRFRVMNLTGAALSAVVNALLGVWPFAAMNAVIAVIDTYWIRRLTRERHDETVYDVVEVGVADAYLRHVLRVHADDVAATHPSFRMADVWAPSGVVQLNDEPAGDGLPGPGRDAARSAFLVLHGDETVGMVLVRDMGGGVGRIELDYVTQRFRDFTPGEFVYRRSGVFADKGFTKIVADSQRITNDYFQRVGFQLVAGRWERPVEAAA